MFVAYTTVFVIFAAVAYTTAVPRASSNKCHSIDSGYLSTFIFTTPGNGGNEALDLNGNKELTFGNGKAVKVAFQACPELHNVQFDSAGRIVVESSNLCLTVTNPSSSSGPYYIKAEECTSNVKPNAAQTWGYGNPDLGKVIYFTGNTACDGGAGVLLKNDDTIELGSRKRIQLTCNHTLTSQSLTLTKTKK